METMGTGIGQSRVPAPARTAPLTICAVAVGVYALLIGLLVIVIYLEDKNVNVPLVVLFVLGALVATVAAWARRTWAAWLALGYSVITLAADAPHQGPELLHPTTAVHTAGAAILLVAGAAAVVVALWASLAARNRVEPAA